MITRFIRRALGLPTPENVFFSFHYERDIWRVNQVRNSWVTHHPNQRPFFDKSLWDEAYGAGDWAIQELIDEALMDTEVTAVLIGQQTFGRRWVRYEIEESIRRNNALLAIEIHNCKTQLGRRDRRGRNPFEEFDLEYDVPLYNWIEDDGPKEFSEWIREAPRARDIV